MQKKQMSNQETSKQTNRLIIINQNQTDVTLYIREKVKLIRA